MVKLLEEVEKIAKSRGWDVDRATACRQAVLAAILNPVQTLDENIQVEMFAHGFELLRVARDKRRSVGLVQTLSPDSLQWETGAEGALDSGECEQLVLDLSGAPDVVTMHRKWGGVSDACLRREGSDAPNAAALRRVFPNVMRLAEFYYDHKAYLLHAATQRRVIPDEWRMAATVARHSLLARYREFAAHHQVIAQEFTSLCEAILSGWSAERRMGRCVQRLLGEGYDYFGGRLCLHAVPLSELSEKESAALDAALAEKSVPLEPSQECGGWYGVIRREGIAAEVVASDEVIVGEYDEQMGGMPVAASMKEYGGLQEFFGRDALELYWRGEDNADQPVQSMSCDHLKAEQARLRWMLSCQRRGVFACSDVPGNAGVRMALYLVEHEMEFRREWAQAQRADPLLSHLKWTRATAGEGSPFVLHRLVDMDGSVVSEETDPMQAVISARKHLLRKLPPHCLTLDEFCASAVTVPLPLVEGSAQQARERLLAALRESEEGRAEPCPDAWADRLFDEFEAFAEQGSQGGIAPRIMVRPLQGGALVVAFDGKPEDAPEVLRYCHHYAVNRAFAAGEHIPLRAAAHYPDLLEVLRDFPRENGPVMH